MEVQQNGNLLGKGIYFSDLLFKSINTQEMLIGLSVMVSFAMSSYAKLH
jgi:hypothetical protein